MFVMTEAAGGLLMRMLMESDAPAGTAIRFVLDENQSLRSKLDSERPGDQVFAHDGRKVLILDQGVSEVLAAGVLDVEDSGRGAKLVIVH